MNGLYSMLLFLFIFGIVIGGINEMGLNAVAIPTSGVQLNETVITDLQSGASGLDLNPLNTLMVVIKFLKVMGAGILAMFFVFPIIYGFLTMAGADPAWALIVSGMIQAPLTFVTLWGLFEIWTARSVT